MHIDNTLLIIDNHGAKDTVIACSGLPKSSYRLNATA
jgi:hypothetical protein